MKEHRGREVEDRVGTWLKSLGVRFIRNARISEGREVDFLIVEPFPAVLEVVVLNSPVARSRKWKRTLYRRLLVASQLGPHVPVIIAYHGVEPRLTQLGDAVFVVDALPSLEDLSRIRVAPHMLEFLKRGSAQFVHFTDIDDYMQVWQSALSWEQLVGESADFKRGTLASGMSNSVEEAVELIEPINIASSTRPRLPEPEMTYLEARINGELERVLGGSPSPIHVDLSPFGGTRMRFDGWSSPRIGTIVVVTKLLGPGLIAHKIPEWIVDARLILGSGSARGDGLVLIPIFRTDSEVDLRFLREVNELESAGWNVFPADFDESVPSFIRYVSQLAGGDE